jgi:hypothetical protein
VSHRISVIEGEQVDTMRVAKDAIPTATPAWRYATVWEQYSTTHSLFRSFQPEDNPLPRPGGSRL